MTVFASIEWRLIRITGSPRGGWQLAESDGGSSQETPFRFRITDDGEGGFQLEFLSVNGEFLNDYHYASVEDAFVGAQECFGIERDEWVIPV